MVNASLMQSEDRLVFKMDTFLVIEYIKTAINVVLDIKFEEIEQKLADNHTEQSDTAGEQDLNNLLSGKDSISYNNCSRPEGNSKTYKRQTSDPSSSAQKNAMFSPRQKTHLLNKEEVKQVRTERSKQADQKNQPSSSMDTTDAVPSCPELYEKLI